MWGKTSSEISNYKTMSLYYKTFLLLVKQKNELFRVAKGHLYI
jgi:hypothetical protein